MIKSLAISILSVLTFSGFASNAKPLTTVDHVDLERYMGKWYEIASIPQYFQRKCVANTTADYQIISQNTVRVVNSCATANRSRISTEGRAKVVDPRTNAKLKVTFAKVGNKYVYTLGGKYWIIDLDPNYRYAVVGHPKRTYGWILSRDPMMSDKVLAEISQNLVAKEYDPCKFMITPQAGGYTTKARLCDVVTPNSLEPVY